MKILLFYILILACVFGNSSTFAQEVPGIVVDQEGQVGINTISPQAQLDIKGNVRISPNHIDSWRPIGYLPSKNNKSSAILTINSVYFLPPPGNKGKYLTLEDARRACLNDGGNIATNAQLQNAYDNGAQWCDAGWTAEGKIRYPMQTATNGCGRQKGIVKAAGINSYGYIGANCIKTAVRINGNMRVYNPEDAADVANKNYVDSQIQQVCGPLNIDLIAIKEALEKLGAL